MEVYWLLGLFILVLVYAFDRDVLAVDFKAIKKFTIFVLSVKILFVVLYRVLGVSPLESSVPPLYYLPLVWWEDIVFSLLPIYYARKYLPNWLATSTTVIASILFALGHLYQGWFAVILISIYPYFISYRYGKKFGYGTVMICHVLYDVIVIGLILADNATK